MGELVNLKRFRKAAARTEREADAAANRAKFGRPKAERRAEEARAELEARRLDGHHLGDDVSPEPETR